MISDDLRQQLEDELGFQLPDETWQYLEDKNYVEDFMVGASTIAQLADEARQILRAGGFRVTPGKPLHGLKTKESRRRSDEGDIDRFEVISDLLAVDARKNANVLAFRSKYLADGLMTIESALKWIQERYEEQGGQHTRWLKFPMPDATELEHAGAGGVSFSPPLQMASLLPPFSLSAVHLDFGGNEGWVRRLPVQTGGVLAYLQELSAELARDYGWAEHQATMFVLTDMAPLVPPVKVTGQTSLTSPVVSRITLTVDPSVTPRQLAEIYSDTRRKMVGPRYRNLSSKHLKLALFAYQQGERSWDSQRRDWNSLHPDEGYQSNSTFARDCRQAIQRVLFPEYSIPGIRVQRRKQKATQ